MEVKILSYTSNPEVTIARAMKSCRHIQPAHALPLELKEEMPKLIRKAIKMGHESVLEHASITFSVEGVSRVCTHQLVRHRLASYSQQSGRHVMNLDFIIPESTKKYLYVYDSELEKLYELLQTMKNEGIPIEDIRYLLPNSVKTNIVVTMNLRELRHFFQLRLSTEAQWEIKSLAAEMLKLAKQVAPNVFEDFQ
jgi:thymidylate synthase (FAD)